MGVVWAVGVAALQGVGVALVVEVVCGCSSAKLLVLEGAVGVVELCGLRAAVGKWGTRSAPSDGGGMEGSHGSATWTPSRGASEPPGAETETGMPWSIRDAGGGIVDADGENLGGAKERLDEGAEGEAGRKGGDGCTCS